MDEAVAAFVRERGQDEIERLYRVINDIIVDVDPEPGDALRDLAAIDDLRLFVSTTPDRVLAKAINEVRFRGRPMTRELLVLPESVDERTVAKCNTGRRHGHRRSEPLRPSRLDAPVRDSRRGPIGVDARITQRQGEPSRLG